MRRFHHIDLAHGGHGVTQNKLLDDESCNVSNTNNA